MTDFSSMTGPELVKAYNTMAMSRGLRTVNRFADAAVGRRRCEAIERMVNGEASVPPQAARPRSISQVIDDMLAIMGEFKTNVRKNRGKLLRVLFNNKGESVSLNKLIAAVYGHGTDNHRGALLMVMKGLEGSIKKKNLPYRIEKSKSSTGVISYGLYNKA